MEKLFLLKAILQFQKNWSFHGFRACRSRQNKEVESFMTDLLLNFQKEISFWILDNLNPKSSASVLFFTNNTRSWTKCRQKGDSISKTLFTPLRF